MAVLQERDDLVDRLVKLATVLRGAGDDERRAGLVHKDRVDLVDDRKVMLALVHLREFGFHVVAQIIKAQLVVGGIGHVTTVGGLLLGLGLLRIDNAGSHTECCKNLAHPFRVAAGEVIVDGNNVHTLTGERIQIGREGRDKGLALAGLHLADVAFMQKDAAHQLNIKGPQAKRTAGAFTAVGKCLGQELVERLATLGAFGQLAGLVLEALVAQRLKLGLERVDLVDDRAGHLDLAVVRGAKDLFGERADAQHILSAPASPGQLLPLNEEVACRPRT